MDSGVGVMKGGGHVDQEKVIEFLRKQIGVSYDKAKEALTQTNNDLIEAIIMLKGKKAVLTEQWNVHSPDLQKRLYGLLRQAHIIRVTVSRKGRTLFVIPAWLGAASFILFPMITLLTTAALLYNEVTLTVERIDV
jgi:hypothetical protein